MTVVALLVSLCSTFLGHPTMRLVDHPAAALLGADGQRSRLADPARPGEVVTVEWARDETVGLLRSGPELFGLWFGLSGGDTDVAYARRTETTTGSGAVARVDTLLSIESAGVRTHAVQGQRAGVVYLPGKLTLAADVQPGSQWTSRGELVAVTGGVRAAPTPYETATSAAAAADSSLAGKGCLDVTEREQRGGGPVGQSVTTWCPGEGSVAVSDDARTIRRAQVAPLPAATPGPDFDWTTVDRLRWTTLRVSHVGSSLLFVSPVAPPGVLPDGTLVYANRSGADLVAVRPQRTAEPTVWRARPGGGIVTAATLGTTTVAVTSERKAVAYGPEGQWLWTADLGDIARVAPQPYGGGVLITTIDGTVTLLSLTDGSVEWRFTAAAEIRIAPVVQGETIVVADQSGRFVRLDRRGQVLWSMEHTKADRMVLVGENLVVAPHAGSTVSAFGVADGELAWQLRPDAAFTDLVGVGGMLVVQSADSVRGYDPATGEQRWRRDLVAQQLAGGAERLVVVTDRDLVVLDPTDGRERSRTPLELGDLSQTAFLIATGPGRLVVTTTTTAAVGTLP